MVQQLREFIWHRWSFVSFASGSHATFFKNGLNTTFKRLQLLVCILLVCETVANPIFVWKPDRQCTHVSLLPLSQEASPSVPLISWFHMHIPEVLQRDELQRRQTTQYWWLLATKNVEENQTLCSANSHSMSRSLRKHFRPNRTECRAQCTRVGRCTYYPVLSHRSNVGSCCQVKFTINNHLSSGVCWGHANVLPISQEKPIPVLNTKPSASRPRIILSAPDLPVWVTLLSRHVFGAVRYAAILKCCILPSAGLCLCRERVCQLSVLSAATWDYLQIGRPPFLNGGLHLNFGVPPRSKLVEIRNETKRHKTPPNWKLERRLGAATSPHKKPQPPILSHAPYGEWGPSAPDSSFRRQETTHGVF